MVNKALSRMAEAGSIRRILRGGYDRPRYSELLQEWAAPKVEEMAKAIARNFGWTIVPCGDTALNLLGLLDAGLPVPRLPVGGASGLQGRHQPVQIFGLIQKCLSLLREDYGHMKNMIFGETPEFEEIMECMERLEREIGAL